LSDFAKIFFELAVTDNWPPVSSESVWAESLGNDLYRLDNIPFFARGVALEDILEAKPLNEELVFRKVHRHAGHSTYRIIPRNVTESADTIVHELELLGCDVERYTASSLLAVDVPPSSDVSAVYAMLKCLELDDVIGFEEGFYFDPSLYGSGAAEP